MLRDLQLPSLHAKKILDVLEGKRLLTPVQQPAPVVEVADVPGEVEEHPLALNQEKYLRTNLRRFQPKQKRMDSMDLFSRVICDLPADKKMSLLQTLSKISKSLEFGGLMVHEDEGGVVSSKSDVASIGGSGGGGGSSSSNGGGGSSSSVTGELSLAGSYSSSKSYGQSKPDANHVEAMAVLDRIGHGMHLHPFQEQNYDLSGRGPLDLVPPTTLIARLNAEFKVHISTADIAILMRKFDVEQRGVVDMVDVLGSAKNAHAKTIYTDAMEGLQRETEIQKKLLIERRNEHKLKQGGKELDGTEVEGTQKKRIMEVVIEKLSAAAYDAIRLKQLKPLNACRLKLSPVEFKALLATLDCKLSARESFFLERRYFQGATGTVDAAMFRSEFVALGKDMIRDSRRSIAMQGFIRALSRGDAPVFPPSAALGSLDPAILRQNILPLPASDLSAVGKAHMTMDMAEDWISDPLASHRNKKTPMRGILSPAEATEFKLDKGIESSGEKSSASSLSTPSLQAPRPSMDLFRPSTTDLFEETESHSVAPECRPKSRVQFVE